MVSKSLKRSDIWNKLCQMTMVWLSHDEKKNAKRIQKPLKYGRILALLKLQVGLYSGLVVDSQIHVILVILGMGIFKQSGHMRVKERWVRKFIEWRFLLLRETVENDLLYPSGLEGRCINVSNTAGNYCAISRVQIFEWIKQSNLEIDAKFFMESLKCFINKL